MDIININDYIEENSIEEMSNIISSEINKEIFKEIIKMSNNSNQNNSIGHSGIFNFNNVTITTLIPSYPSIKDLVNVQPMDKKYIQDFFNNIKYKQQFDEILIKNPTLRILDKKTQSIFIETPIEMLKNDVLSLKDLSGLVSNKIGNENLVVRGNDCNIDYMRLKYFIGRISSSATYNPSIGKMDEEVRTGTYKLEEGQKHDRYLIVVFTHDCILEISDIDNTIWVTLFEGIDKESIENKYGNYIKNLKNLYTEEGMLQVWNLLVGSKRNNGCFLFENGKCIKTYN